MTFVREYGNYVISELGNYKDDYYEIRVRQICRIIKLHEGNQMNAHDSIKAIASIFDHRSHSLLQK